jgi:hypothetical protein
MGASMNRYRVIAGPAHFAVGDVLAVDREHYLAFVGKVAFISRRDSEPRLIVRVTAPLQFATGAVIGLDVVPERLAAIVRLESPPMVASRQLDHVLARGAHKQGVRRMATLNGKQFGESFRAQMERMRQAMDDLQTDMAGAVMEHAEQVSVGKQIVKEVRQTTAEMQAAFGASSNGAPPEREFVVTPSPPPPANRDG